ncbi:Glucanosyltransferase-domain-containing protein [Chaetomidium leptoderma]|uniref:1,3-beta-glucanosyltransferase n=1 Tax=Chaetomidium leptoderma TaxID=669021 RepID=A0AAN7A2E3_9PEZI|nr:Glucanosyltransferase-domain-containing protein [Chaetomidium leptoderma]
MCSFISFCLLLFLSSSPVAALSPISVKGVSYIPGDSGADPLVDTKQCQIDASLMKKAGINTVYVYTADSTQDHDGCMDALAEHGIYVWLQLGDFPRVTSPTQTGPQWTLSIYAAWTEVLDAFAGYANLLAFGIGQETITANATSTTVAPSLKAAARDLRAFRTARGYRPIPLSYSAADVASLRLPTAHYLTCGGSNENDAASTSIDLLGLNIFLGCAKANWTALQHDFTDLLPIPVVISEAGCRTTDAGGRDFADVALVLGGDEEGGGFRDVFSGVSVFEWAMGGGDSEGRYGVVRYPDDEAARTGEPEALPQWETLSAVFAAAAASSGTPRASSYTPRVSAAPVVCPTSDAGKGWLVDADAPLPTIEGLQIGTVTVRTTVTDRVGSKATGAAGGGGAAGEGDGGLSTGAIAGVAVGCVIGALGLATGILLCLRRRRRAPPAAYEEQEVVVDELPPPSYTYPANKAELPEQHMAAAEMDSSPYSTTSSTGTWKMPIEGGRDDSPTVTELPDRKWRRTTQYELEDNYLARMGGAGEQTGTWQISPLSPAGRR